MKKATKFDLIMRWIRRPLFEWQFYKTHFPRPWHTALHYIIKAPWR